MHPKLLKIEDYTYLLPEDRIAAFPKEERDLSQLLVYRDGALQQDIYRNIAQYLPENALVVFNQTKVVQVRLLFQKETGARIEIFCLEPDARYADMQSAMAQKSFVYWQCLVGGAQKWKDGTVLSLFDAQLNVTIQAHLVEKREGNFIIKLAWSDGNLTFADILHAIGKVPLPPYMHREMQDEDKERYQTIYAREEGSVAAPTAGLHFTKYIFDDFVAKHMQAAFLTLHVGAGTFKQVKSEQLADHDMHAEWIEVDLDFLNTLLQLKEAIVAVGTTSMRTLESLYWIGLKLHHQMPIDWQGIAVAQWDPYDLTPDISISEALFAIKKWMQQQQRNKLITRTQILIAPSYQPKIVDYLVTNFHQPQSTLLLLIAALIGDDWRNMYSYALQHDFRFLSYGDGCLIPCAKK
jgi:S-adenosylmethionine:tRNA ribosyltransferase-isomerase